MAQKTNKSMKETLLEMVKPFIPTEIVMSPLAYSKPLNQEKTIENYKLKVKEAFIKENPRYSMTILEQLDHDLEYILSKRILVGTTQN